MALNYCTSCKEYLDKDAKTCPKCNKKAVKMKLYNTPGILSVLLSVAGFILLIVCYITFDKVHGKASTYDVLCYVVSILGFILSSYSILKMKTYMNKHKAAVIMALIASIVIFSAQLIMRATRPIDDSCEWCNDLNTTIEWGPD